MKKPRWKVFYAPAMFINNVAYRITTNGEMYNFQKRRAGVESWTFVRQVDAEYFTYLNDNYMHIGDDYKCDDFAIEKCAHDYECSL